MSYRQITGISYSEFEQMIAHKKVVIFHPATPYRTIFLAYVYRYAAENLLYYRGDAHHTTFAAWLSALSVALDLNVTVPDTIVLEQIPALATDIATALTRIGTEHSILLLNDPDTVATLPEFRKFIPAFITALPETFRVVISARLLTHEPFAGLCRDGIAGVLGTEFRSNDLMYTVEQRSRPQLEVYAFGQGHGYMNGQEITQWDGALPRNLFFFFMDRDNITRQGIFEVFWLNLSKNDATNVFHVTKRKITERMSELVPDVQSYEMTQYKGGSYIASDKIARYYDVAEFEDALQQANNSGTDTDKERFYRRALAVYTAPYLQTIDMAWVIERREKLARQYENLLADMGHLQQRKGNHDAALGFFMRTLREAPQREDIYRDVMTTYAKLGRKSDALRQFDILVKYLDDSIGLPPSRKSRDLYEQIKNQSDDDV